MTQVRLAVLVLLAAAFLSAPLGALCSACCVPPAGDALSEPMPCCGDACGPSFTAVRRDDPAKAAAKTNLDPPVLNVLSPAHADALYPFSKPLPAIFSPSPTESPPAASSVLRL